MHYVVEVREGVFGRLFGPLSKEAATQVLIGLVSSEDEAITSEDIANGTWQSGDSTCTFSIVEPE